MNSMLESTLKVLEKRRKELPKHPLEIKYMVDHFEGECLCIASLDLPIPNDQPDDVKALYYLMWCGCCSHDNYFSKVQ